MAEKSTKLVKVVVAPRRSIYTNGVNGGQGKMNGPGKVVEVEEWEIARLVKDKFILDPFAKKKTAAEIEESEFNDAELKQAYGLSLATEDDSKEGVADVKQDGQVSLKKK